jgi:trigger factor
MFNEERMAGWAESLRPEAEKRIRTSLALGTIAKAEGITVTEEEVDQEIVEYAGQYRVDPAAVRQQLIQTGGWTTLADEVLSNKILDWLLEKAQVTEGPIPEKYAPKAEGTEAPEAANAGEAEATEAAPAEENA